MQSVKPRDPAPSRWAYRLHRLWLTPLVRRLTRVGLPAFAIVFLAGYHLSEPANRAALLTTAAEMRQSIEDRPEFRVDMMVITGASDELATDIREVAAVDFPISSFDLDLPGLQDVIGGLDAVARVDLRVRGGRLEARVVERVPAVVWRVGEVVELLDPEGHRVVGVESRAARPDLPLLVGTGADDHVPEALGLLNSAAAVASRVRGLVRVGERRWDVVLDEGQRILLPESAPDAALAQVMALDEANDLLSRDVTVVDMRNSTRPTLRLAPRAVEALRQTKGQARGDLGE